MWTPRRRSHESWSESKSENHDVAGHSGPVNIKQSHLLENTESTYPEKIQIGKVDVPDRQTSNQ